MEGRSSFKECPRCGLRNRVSATKCDFCGYEFKGSGEEWIDYVDVLEKLSKGDEVRPVDEDLSKKIMSTMVKKKDVEEVMVDGAVAAAATATIRDDEPIEEGQIVSEADEPKEVVEFVDSMIEGDEAEPITTGIEEPEKEAEIAEAASLEYREEPTPEEPDTILETEDSERDEIHGLAAAAASGAVSAKMARPEEPVHEIPEETVIEEVPVIEEESEPGEISGVEAEAAVEEVPEFQEEVAVEEETIESIIPVELEEPIPTEIEEAFPEPVDAAPAESLSALEEQAVELEPVEVEEEAAIGSSSIPHVASMGAGAVLYLLAMGGYLFLSLDATLVWAMAILGSVMMLFGFRRFYDVVLPVSEARKRNTGH